jgi:hypothetical protein
MIPRIPLRLMYLAFTRLVSWMVPVAPSGKAEDVWIYVPRSRKTRTGPTFRLGT